MCYSSHHLWVRVLDLQNLLKVAGDHSEHLDGEFPLSLSYYVSWFIVSLVCHILSIAGETWVYLYPVRGSYTRAAITMLGEQGGTGSVY